MAPTLPLYLERMEMSTTETNNKRKRRNDLKTCSSEKKQCQESHPLEAADFSVPIIGHLYLDDILPLILVNKSLYRRSLHDDWWPDTIFMKDVCTVSRKYRKRGHFKSAAYLYAVNRGLGLHKRFVFDELRCFGILHAFLRINKLFHGNSVHVNRVYVPRRRLVSWENYIPPVTVGIMTINMEKEQFYEDYRESSEEEKSEEDQELIIPTSIRADLVRLVNFLGKVIYDEESVKRISMEN